MGSEDAYSSFLVLIRNRPRHERSRVKAMWLLIGGVYKPINEQDKQPH